MLRHALLLLLLAVSSLACGVHALTSQMLPNGTQAFGANVPAGCSLNAGTCLRIGIYRCANPDDATQCRIAGFNKMTEWYIQRIAAMGNQIAGIPVQFILANVSGTTANPATPTRTWFLGKAATNVSVFEPFVDAVILTPGSAFAQRPPAGPTGPLPSAMELLERAKIPAIASNSPFSGLYRCPLPNTTALSASPPCVAYNTRRFEYAHSMASSGEQYFQPWVGLMKLKKAKTLAVVYTAVALYPSVYQGVLTAANDLGLSVIYNEMIGITATATQTALEVERAAIPGIIEKLKRYQPEGLVLATQNCKYWIWAFRDANYAPNSLVTSSCTDDLVAAAEVGKDMAYVMGSAQWSPDMNGNDYLEDADYTPWALFPHQKANRLIGDTSPRQFQALYRSLMGNSTTPGFAEAAVLVGLTVLEGAVTLAKQLSPDGTISKALLNQQLKDYYQSTFYGLMSTNRYGMNQQKQIVINQRDAAGVLRIVSPSSSANLDIIYPMPPFSDRHYGAVLLDTPVEFFVIAFMALCMAFTLSLMGYLFLNRNNQVFQAAGLPFYLLMGLGCICAYGSVLVWGVENNEASCKARIWMWTMGFHMFVDPLLASSWRISRIFSQKLQTVKLTNKTVGLVSLALLMPQVIINILWASLAPLEPSIVSEDLLRPAHTSYTTCSSGDQGVIFAGVTLGYSGLLLISACYLAYRVRKAYRLFNDARPIAMSMYIFTVTAAIILVIQLALDAQNVNAQKVLFGLRSVGIIAAYQSSLSLLYFRRILGQEGGVSKYKPGGKAPHDSALSSDDSSHKPTGERGNTGTRGTPGHTHLHIHDPSGKLVFNKDGAASGTHTHSKNAPNNVHVHIQPPVSPNTGSGEANSPAGSPSAGASPMQRPLNPGGRSVGFTSSPGSGSARGSVAAASNLQLEGLATPSLFAIRTGGNRPPGLSPPPIIQVPPAIPLPTPQEMQSMEPAALATLVQQFHAQNQILRSHVRQQNLASAAISRGEMIGPSRNASLPGTPDRSPRNAGIERRPSGMGALSLGQGLMGNDRAEGSPSPPAVAVTELVSMRPYGVSAAGQTESNSDASSGHGSGKSTDSLPSISPANNNLTSAQNVSMTLQPALEEE